MPTLDKIWSALQAPLHNPFKSASLKAGNVSARLPMPSGGDGLFSGLLSGIFGGTRGRVNWHSKAGDISSNSAVAACLQWICTSWPQQTVKVVTVNGDDEMPQPDHPFLDLLRTPNDQYQGVWLEQALLKDFWTKGRAYCQMILSPLGPVELTYLPAYCTRAKAGPGGRLAYFEYKPNGKPIHIPPSEILHFRNGIDPNNLLEGYPPLQSASCEITADNALSEWAATLALNNGVPMGGVLSPAKSGPDAPSKPLGAEEAKLIKAAWQEATTGDARGQVLVMPVALEYNKVAFSPKDMDVSSLRQTPEERICALFQIPPGVAGLGAGLDRNTFSNYDSSKKAVWEDNMIPVGDYFASVWTIAARLFPGSEDVVVRYDRSGVRVLHEDETAKNEDALDQFERGAITLEECRTQLGYETDDKTRAELAADKPAPVVPTADPLLPVKSFRSIKAAVKKKHLI